MKCMLCRSLFLLYLFGFPHHFVQAQVVANSDFNDGPQGWVFDEAAGWRATDGNLGGCLQNTEVASNGPAWAIAAPAFLGDWRPLNGSGELTFDHKRASDGGGVVLQYLPIRIEVESAAGTAFWESELLPGPGPWRTFRVPIDRATWHIASEQQWTEILANVQRVRIFLEQVSNNQSPEDLNLLDNVSLAKRCDSIDFNNDTSLFDPQDIEAFLSVYSEGPCVPASATCNDIDFNNDTSLFDPCDIGSFLTMYSEGPCTPCGQ